MSNFLDSFDTASDDLAGVRAMVLARDSIDIQSVYCLHTGKPIGTYDSSELLEAIYEEGDADAESLADALVVRCVSSMRPSPALNKPDRGTIQAMIARRPVDALAYLLNRLYGNRHLIRASRETTFTPLLERIRTWQILDSTHNLDVKSYTHWLLEIDSLFNLHDVTPPMFMVDRLGKLIVTRLAEGKPLIDFIARADALSVFESWVFDRLADGRQLEIAATREIAWQRGNSMTKVAVYHSYLENPEIANRRFAEAHKRKVAAAKRVEKPVSAKTHAKREAEANALDVLEKLFAANPPIPQVATPAKPALRTAGQLFLNRIGKATA